MLALIYPLFFHVSSSKPLLRSKVQNSISHESSRESLEFLKYNEEWHTSALKDQTASCAALVHSVPISTKYNYIFHSISVFDILWKIDSWKKLFWTYRRESFLSFFLNLSFSIWAHEWNGFIFLANNGQYYEYSKLQFPFISWKSLDGFVFKFNSKYPLVFASFQFTYTQVAILSYYFTMTVIYEWKSYSEITLMLEQNQIPQKTRGFS